MIMHKYVPSNRVANPLSINVDVGGYYIFNFELVDYSLSVDWLVNRNK